jgi:hypothetical protein
VQTCVNRIVTLTQFHMGLTDWMRESDPQPAMSYLTVMPCLARASTRSIADLRSSILLYGFGQGS